MSEVVAVGLINRDLVQRVLRRRCALAVDQRPRSGLAWGPTSMSRRKSAGGPPGLALSQGQDGTAIDFTCFD